VGKVRIYRGTIDRDDMNEQSDHLHVNNDFYFLENYLCFPINLSYVIKNRNGKKLSESMISESSQRICNEVIKNIKNKIENKKKKCYLMVLIMEILKRLL
jgi:hypothetical protein